MSLRDEIGDKTMSRTPLPVTESRPPVRRRSAFRMLIGSAIVVAILYVARPIALPLAVAILVSFMLRPVVSALERTFLRRTAAIVLTMVFFLATTAMVGWLLVVQGSALARELADYSGNLEAKLARFHSDSTGSIALLERTLERLSRTGSEQESVDMRVRVVPERRGLLERYAAMGPTIEFLASAFLVVVLVFFLLKDREQFRDKLLRVAGRAHLTVTSQAIGEMLHRISQYLFAFSLLNVIYGVLVGIGLFALGMPHAIFWGILAALARYIPYVGAAISSITPVILALAIFPDWYTPLAVLALFILLDQLIGGFIEPMVIGNRVGISPIMILMATMFWGWLWGPIGMLLATPISVSLTVAGELIPGFRIFAIIFRREIPLEAYLSFYNRLISRDRSGAMTSARRHARSNGLEKTFNGLFVPTLSFAAEERETGRVTHAQELFIRDAIRELVLELGDDSAREVEDPPVIAASPVGDEAISLGSLMLLELLREQGFVVEQCGPGDLRARLRDAKARPVDTVLVSCTEPAHLEAGIRFLEEVAKEFPEVLVIAGGAEFGRNSQRVTIAGASIVPTNLIAARDQYLRERKSLGNLLTRATMTGRIRVDSQ